ncbi:hypothetical protein HY639_00640 [Candidatus Woesearchaeota archaeon]|nr:hypothetical protein [Candidatus Woesearchaeota archaeon]
MTIEDKVNAFLAQSVPPAGTTAFGQWSEQCKALGQEALPYFVKELEEDSKNTYAALLGMRILGGEAWYRDDETVPFYEIRYPGETKWRRITPKGPA